MYLSFISDALFLFYKKIVYSGSEFRLIQALNHQIFRNYKRYCPASARIFVSHFSAVACFGKFETLNRRTNIFRLTKSMDFNLERVILT